VLWTLPDPVRAIRNWRRLVRPGGRIVVIDGLFRLGTHQPSVTPPASGAGGAAGAVTVPAPWREAWNEHYSEAVRANLPLFATEAIEPSLAAFRDAGFPEARLIGLPDVDRAEQAEQERAPDRGPRSPRFVITAEV
jgi:hypothetical protein